MRKRVIWFLFKLAEWLDKDAVNRAVLFRADALRREGGAGADGV